MKFKYIIAAFLAALIAVFGFGSTFASADITAYTGVLEDLRTDKNFNVDDYSQIEDDYSVKIIQIAESSERELFVYVYQPSSKLHFTFIDISTDRKQWKNYRLGLINSAGVFYKYRVNGFTVSEAAERYYDISNILRSYDSKIDEPPADGQTVSEVGCKVAQFWTATTAADGKVTYTVIDTEVVIVKKKVVGYCAYDDGVKLGWGSADGYTKAYFVAFSTDKPIDKLISADLSFWVTKAKFYVCGNLKEHDHGYLYDMHDGALIDYGTGMFGEDEGEGLTLKPPLTITHKQKFSNEGGGNIRPAYKYTWDRIRSTADFVADNNNKNYILEQGAEEELKDTQWVLNFYEAHDRYFYDNVWLSFIPGVTQIPGVADGEAQFEMTYDVQVLRLEFETDGERYNLGVVDGRQSGEKQFNEYIAKKPPWWVWLIVAALILFVIGILGAIFKPIGEVLTAPFKQIASDVNKAAKKRKAKPKKSKRQSKKRR